MKSQNTNRTLLRLEEKLIELGYTQEDYLTNIYYKFIGNIYIFINAYNLNKSGVEYPMMTYTKQEHIDNLQQAFNVMQKDLEELKKYER